MARVVRFHTHGGPEVLRIEDVHVAPPGPGEVRIRVKALGLNRAESLIRQGRYIETPPLPARLGLEASGIVDAIGPGVEGFAHGAKVSVIPPISMRAHPAHGELATFPASHIVGKPDHLSWEEAAALWMPFLTAYGALVQIAGLQAGEVVAITAASSSVGLAAIQIANRLGAIPVAITRSESKRPMLLAHGAAHVVVSAGEKLAEDLVQVAGAKGIRLALDAVGGPMVEMLAISMARDGIVVEYGGLSPEPTPFPFSIALARRLTFKAYLVHEVVEDPIRLAAAQRFILEGLAVGEFQPTVARTFPFEKIIDAYRYLESGEQAGKVVVTL